MSSMKCNYLLIIFLIFTKSSIVLGTDGIKKMDQFSFQDIQVEAIVYDSVDLQLKVNWTGKHLNEATYFNVFIKPMGRDKCYNKPCFEYELISNTTEIVLPKVPMSHIEHSDECKIEPGCQYDVLVQTANLKNHINMTYTVPDCVENICSCDHVRSLQKLKITAYIQSQFVYVDWNITHPINDTGFDIEINTLMISVGKQKNDTTTPWLLDILIEINQTLYTANNSFTDIGRREIYLNDTILPGYRYLIKAHLTDEKGCRGHETNYTIIIPSDVHRTKNSNVFFIITISILLLSLIIITCSFVEAFKKCRRKKRRMNGPTLITMHKNSIYKGILELSDDLEVEGGSDDLEVDDSCLTIGPQIGVGAFGRVFIAQAKNLKGRSGVHVVAVKQSKKKLSPDEQDEFLREIETMKKLSRHPNVVSLIGYCTKQQPFSMIMEFVGCGDLLHYLRQVRAKHEARSTVVSGVLNGPTGGMNGQVQSQQQTPQVGPLGKYLELIHSSSSGATSNSDCSYITQGNSNSFRPSVAETMMTLLSHNPDLMSLGTNSLEYVLDHMELHNFAIQIARGMNHLEKRHITHRDLAARNILIDENKTLKISDFGLSRSGIYVNTRNKKVPLRWLSLEAMRDHLYSSKSDVWAFGIVLWEIGTLGGFPYPTVGNHELLSYLSSGQRLQRPENCSEKLYDLMLSCWNENPDDRPRFVDIITHLEPTNQKIYVNFDELDASYVFPPTVEQIKNNNHQAFM